MRTERIADTDVRFRRHGAGDYALVFVHGFLDDQYVWDGVISELKTTGAESAQLELAGCGDRTEASGSFTLDRFVAEVGAVVDALDKPFVIVGQSMAAPIAELVAAARPARALGLVLVTPIPLAGTQLPSDVVEPFRSLGGDPEGQRAVRQQLSTQLTDADLDRLVVVGGRVRPEVVRDLVDCWNTGHPDGARPSGYTGPVLVIRGGDDGFVTPDLVADGVVKRFGSAESVVIDRAGHWVHIERPAAVAAELDAFLTKTLTAGSGSTAQGVRPQKWTSAFGNKSADAFGEAFAEDVVLEASVLARPIEGREQVKQVMGTASAVYESLVFTREATSERRTYLEWEATAFGGESLRGITILTKDTDGQIVRAAIHHRPLNAALRFSAELRERLRGAVDPAHFYDRG